MRIDRRTVANVISLTLLYAFLFYYFKPNYLLLKTITSGGDTASHYYPLFFLKKYLLPKLKVVGWCPGWYAGFPIFQFYFPFLFIVGALLSYVIPLQVSFKLITVLGTFLLPLMAFFSLKSMRFEFPIPIIGAAFTFPFLFNQGNSMWGGNIPSTLAGEFSYSFSLSLTLLFLGLLYSSIKWRKNLLRDSLLVSLITFTHVYTTLFSLASSIFFLFERELKKAVSNFVYLFKVYSIGFLLLGFWLVPLVLRLEYTTPYAFKWIYSDIRSEILPDVLLPFSALAILGIILSFKLRDERVLFFIFTIIASAILYFLSPTLGVVNIRFVPFIQLMMCIIAAYPIGKLLGKMRASWLIVVIVTFTLVWVKRNVTYIPFWIKWNYEGFENKELWETFRDVNEFVKGSYRDPRVVFEHSHLHDKAGTSRAFESLPLFSGRSTYEGLYMQSSISAPFIFYFQTEISKTAPCPFPQWPCTAYNSTRAAKHLAMFNVEYVIAVTDFVKNDLKRNELYELVATFEPYEVFRLRINPNSYVTVPKYMPVAFRTTDWKEVSYEWFKRDELMDVPLVFTDDTKDFSLSSESLEDLPRVRINVSCEIKEDFGIEEIRFETNCTGVPHIISVSYYPNWKVEGARKVYLVSPSFMLVIPNRKEVRLYYADTLVDVLGKLATVLGIFLIILSSNQNLSRFVPRYRAS